MRSGDSDDLRLLLVDDATMFLFNEEDSRMVVTPADRCINKPTLSVLFHSQAVYHFGKKV